MLQQKKKLVNNIDMGSAALQSQLYNAQNVQCTVHIAQLHLLAAIVI